MLEKILEKCFEEEAAQDQYSDNIKSAVLSRIDIDNIENEEDKPMKKHFRIKPFLIAAAITVTGAATLVTANAATDNAIGNYLAKTFSFKLGDKEYTGTITSFEDVDGNVTEVELDIPDGDGIAITKHGDGDIFVITEEGDSDGIAVHPLDGTDSDVIITQYYNF